MKLTLMIEGSAATIAAVLADLDKRNDGTTIATVSTEPAAPALPSASMPAAVGTMPQTTMSMPTASADEDEDDDGDTGAPMTGDVDAEGVRWDERIHSGGKAVTAKGVWKKKRGVSDDLIAQVVAEQRGGGTPTPAPMGMPAMAPTPMPQMAPVPSAAPGMPGMAPTGPTFPEFMQTLSGQMTAGKISTEQVQWAAGQLELNAITDLGTQPEKIGKAIELFQQYGLWA